MKCSAFFMPTAREAPKDAKIMSHILMIRSGMIKKLSNGIYALLPLGYRVVRKIEQIVREEMDRIGGSEFYLPVLIDGELWKTSGRWFDMGPELFRLKDRNEQDFVLAPTHEEVFTYLLKDHIKSYRDLPLVVYQIGLKFRDEIRPRYGVMRGKSFIMKDAYSFHRHGDEASLDKTYRDMAEAYRRIFLRCGLETVPVLADSGAMGGSQSEEFMVPSKVGEEEIVKCDSCGYSANVERATSKLDKQEYRDLGEIQLIETPDIKTIEQLENFLDIPSTQMIKTMLYKVYNPRGEKEYVIVLIRGDLEVNETKLKNYLGAVEISKVEFDESLRELGIPIGFAGPVGLDEGKVEKIKIVADESIAGIKGAVTGANRENYHYKNVNEGRDFTVSDFVDLRLVKEGDRCPVCETPLNIFKGIELGHIFKLGYKYSKAFSVEYLEQDGSTAIPLMGCYGIGIERTAAAVIERHHDDNGIKWPITVAPFHVYILPIKYTGKMKEVSERFYSEFANRGYEPLLDDRDLRPGVKFKDADLIGVPYRVNIGDKGLADGKVEVVVRDTGERIEVTVERLVDFVCDKIEEDFKRYSSL